MKMSPRRLPKLPRFVYWAIGAFIACSGALAARVLAERFPVEYQVPIWLGGGVMIFLGAAILSLGTRHRLDPVEDQIVADDRAGDPRADAGAGEGNRTLA